MNSRRDFFKKSALLGLSSMAGSLLGSENNHLFEKTERFFTADANQFQLPLLNYPFNALEPFIDKQTMEIHYTKHHQAYVDKLNAAVNSQNMNFVLSDEDKCKSVDSKTATVIRNNLGGHYNHTLFWNLLKPNPEFKRNLPQGRLADAIHTHFKSFDEFKKEFSDKALKLFGSGWCWLIVNDKNTLSICTTANQDNPLMGVSAEQGKPILALDVWEHAYYLKYQNKRAEYIENWWNVVNWETAELLFSQK